jgi:hypothetical protein
MFCLRRYRLVPSSCAQQHPTNFFPHSWLPLLFIPTNAPPIFVVLFFLCTFFLSRPCVYCSFLLAILFFTSCYWSDQCFFDLSSNWFEPRPMAPLLPPDENKTKMEFNSTVAEMVNSTAGALAAAAMEEVARRRAEWTGLGLEWVRSLLGKREWRIDCMMVNIRL